LNITQARLQELLHYDPATGIFTWLVATNNRRHVGEVAGSLRPDGYIQLKVDSRMYRAHRLAWMYMTGKWPVADTDHVKGVRHDNRWKKLREASRAMNCQNRRHPHSNNSSGRLLGVSRRNGTGGFQARIRVDGKERRLGTFQTAAIAHAAYVAAKRRFHSGCTI
jgi:hypothetical protein